MDPITRPSTTSCIWYIPNHVINIPRIVNVLAVGLVPIILICVFCDDSSRLYYWLFFFKLPWELIQGNATHQACWCPSSNQEIIIIPFADLVLHYAIVFIIKNSDLFWFSTAFLFWSSFHNSHFSFLR